MGNDEQQKQALYDALQHSDVEIARVTEDLIYLLIQKDLILFTELPEVVQSKLLARETLRHELGAISVSIISEDETI